MTIPEDGERMLPKYAILFPELSFYFPELHFNFPEFNGIVLLFSRRSFLFLKNARIYQNFSLVFPNCLLFIYCLRLFLHECLISSWLYLSLVLIRAAQGDNTCFVLVSFTLGTLYWPTCVLDNLKTSTSSMIFQPFHSKFTLHYSLQNAVVLPQTPSGIAHCLWQYENKVPVT